MIEPILEAERLLRYGLLDRAEALYRNVAEADPSNGFALVGLASVAAERGDEEAAYRYSVEAVRVDPANGVARALAARTAELLAVQGKPVEPTATPGRGRLLKRLRRR